MGQSMVILNDLPYKRVYRFGVDNSRYRTKDHPKTGPFWQVAD